MKAQASLTLDLETCARCGQPIRSGEPHVQTASVDISGGRAVASPARSYHIRGGCYEAAKQEARVATSARAPIAA